MEFELLLEKKISEIVEKKFIEFQISRSPWVKTQEIVGLIDKQPEWIIKTFCTLELQKRKLVKKIGREWHFKNPEFLNYIHDEWWDKQ